MTKPAELYVIGEPETLAASNVIPIAGGVAGSAPPRERSWRNLVRLLEKNLLPASRHRGKR
jgi:hypothetical protein